MLVQRHQRRVCGGCVSECALDALGMRPLVEALPHNTHLRTLHCAGNGISDAFAADVLLPAVLANTSLRTLVVDDDAAHAAQAEALVRDRR